MDHSENSSGGDGELTLRELILKLQEFWYEAWRSWVIIGLFVLAGAAFFIYKKAVNEPTYSAEIRFIVNGESGGIGGLGGLLGNFGISQPGATNPFKILEVGRSKRILSNVLFSEYNQDTLLVNKIIETYDLAKKWGKKNPDFLGFHFTETNIDSMNQLSRSGFNRIYKYTAGVKADRSKALYQINLNEDEGIFTISSETEDEKVSYQLVEEAYDNIKYFFEELSLSDQRKTRDLLKEKSDSIRGLVNYKSIALARFDDQNRGLVLRERKVIRDKLLLEIQGLTVAFTESIKNFEFADYSYKDSKPLFLEIDRPIMPLDIKAQSLIVNIIKGIIIGGLLGLLFVSGRKVYRDTMRVA